MKNLLKNTVAVLAMATALYSCSSDDSANEISGNGSLKIEFDNAFGDNDLILVTQPNATSQGETLKINTVKYIVSNIVLTNENGETFTYPKSESYFITNEADEESQVIELNNIPAGNYTKIKFGIGVDEEQFNLGASGQGDFLAHAESENMFWDWTDGYKFVTFEGTFTSSAVTSETPFTVGLGKTTTNYNYNDRTLDLPTKALVRTTITPEIHIIADVSKIVDGVHKFKFADNMNGSNAAIKGDANLSMISANLDGMFSVNHVHND